MKRSIGAMSHLALGLHAALVCLVRALRGEDRRVIVLGPTNSAVSAASQLQRVREVQQAVSASTWGAVARSLPHSTDDRGRHLHEVSMCSENVFAFG